MRRKAKGTIKEWLKASLIAIVITLIVRAFFFQSFIISNSQMEASLLPGDYILVNKWSAGARTPITLLSFPFFEQSLYLNWITFKARRLKEINFKRGDLLLFNYPKEINKAIDKRNLSIHRLIGLPGDTVIINNKKAIVNKIPEASKSLLKYEYKVTSKKADLSAEFFTNYHISEGNRKKGDLGFYRLFMTEEAANSLSHDKEILNIKKQTTRKRIREEQIFPCSKKYYWNSDYFGPLIVPQKGMEIELNRKNIVLYQEIIMNHENKTVEVLSKRVYINGQIQSSYTFEENYYFMLGDNRDNTIDSRYWGLLPESHITGKCSFIWFSLNKNMPGRKKIRWKRLFSNEW